MKKNKRSDKFFAVTFIFLFTACSALVIFHAPRAMSEKENRTLAQFPKFSFSSIADGSFMDGFESYAADQFRWRDKAVTLKADIEKLIGKKDNNGIYFAKDNYLIQRSDRFSDSVLSPNMDSIVNMSALDEYNITVASVPTAFEILKDKLPDHVYDDRISRVQNYIHGSLDGWVNVCDTTQILNEHKDDYIFYRNDHHQTSLGSYYVYQALGPYLGYQPYTLDSFDREIMSDSFLGTTWSKASISSAEPDTIEKFTLKNSNIQCTVEYPLEGNTFDSIYQPDFLDTKDKYSFFLGGNHALTVIRSNCGTGRKLAVFKDSYSHSVAPFLANHFDEIHLIDLRYYNDDMYKYMGENGITDVLLLYEAESFLSDSNIKKLGDIALTTDYFYAPPYGYLDEQEAVDNDYFADALFFGDSLIDGMGLYSGLPSVFLGKTSLSTITAFTFSANDGSGTMMDSMLSKTGIGKYYICLGMNEGGYISPEDFKGYYKKITDGIKSVNPNAVIYIMSITPIERSAEGGNGITASKIKTLNSSLIEFAQTEGCYYLDVYSCLAEPDGYLADGVASDGVHFGAPYYARWTEYLKTHAVKTRKAVRQAAAIKYYAGGGAADTDALAQQILNGVSFVEQLNPITENIVGSTYSLGAGEVLGGSVYVTGGATAEEIAVFELASPEAAQAFTAKLNSRVETKKADFESYRPDEMAKLSTPLIKVKGNLAILCIANDTSAAESIIDNF